MFDLTGKTALVTGASGAIGGAIARALHTQGATVAVSGTRTEALEAIATTLRDRVYVLPCDLADKDAVEALIPSAEEKWRSSIFLSLTPGSTAIIFSCNCGTRIGTELSRLTSPRRSTSRVPPCHA